MYITMVKEEKDEAYILLERGMEIFMMKQLNLQVHLKSFLLRG